MNEWLLYKKSLIRNPIIEEFKRKPKSRYNSLELYNKNRVKIIIKFFYNEISYNKMYDEFLFGSNKGYLSVLKYYFDNKWLNNKIIELRKKHHNFNHNNRPKDELTGKDKYALKGFNTSIKHGTFNRFKHDGHLNVSEPELFLGKMLSELNIDYIHGRNTRVKSPNGFYYYPDYKLESRKLFIEVDGMYKYKDLNGNFIYDKYGNLELNNKYIERSNYIVNYTGFTMLHMSTDSVNYYGSHKTELLRLINIYSRSN